MRMHSCTHLSLWLFMFGSYRFVRLSEEDCFIKVMIRVFLVMHKDSCFIRPQRPRLLGCDIVIVHVLSEDAVFRITMMIPKLWRNRCLSL